MNQIAYVPPTVTDLGDFTELTLCTPWGDCRDFLAAPARRSASDDAAAGRPSSGPTGRLAGSLRCRITRVRVGRSSIVAFLILLDRSFAPEEIDRFTRTVGGMVLSHASGRPWLVGHWNPSEVTEIEAGDRRLVVFGRTRVNRDSLGRELAAASTLHDLDGLADRLPGAVRLLVSMNGRTRSQGTLAGTDKCSGRPWAQLPSVLPVSARCAR